MHQAWLNPINNKRDILVPTRSLATELAHQIAQEHIKNNQQVWQTPTILTWRDFIERLYEDNRLALSEYAQKASSSEPPMFMVGSSINTQQAALLWTRVIENTKRQESELALLNVQQTVRAVARSWKLMHEWQLDPKTLQSSHIRDTMQFATWCDRYRELLISQNLIDEPLMLEALIHFAEVEALNFDCTYLDVYAFDLLTLSQQKLLDALAAQGLEIEYSQLAERRQETNDFICFKDQRAELEACFQEARRCLEEHPDSRINIVVPDLQRVRSVVEEIAADTFYPGRPPLELINNNLVYRFSLGKSLLEWPATAAANSILKLLRGRVKLSDLRNCLRSRFARICRQNEQAIEQFLFWLQSNRHSYVHVSELHDLAQHWQTESGRAEELASIDQFLAALQTQFVAIQADLQNAKQSTGYRAISFTQWRRHLTAWLECWGWSTSTDSESFSTVQFQLAEKWHDLMGELMSLGMVQQSAGLVTVLDTLYRMLRDTVFLPKAVDSPILVSGIYEAIGRPADVNWIVGMDDRYPSVSDKDPFLGHHLRQISEYPASSSLQQIQQANKVIDSLMSHAVKNILSFARTDDEDATLRREPSALFRQEKFIQSDHEPAVIRNDVALERYEDGQGPPVDDASRLKGGTRIFEDQSNCEFRAFVTHRLHFSDEEEIEFGLDHLDRGNIVHLLLDRVWEKIGSQDQLHALIESNSLKLTVRKSIDELIGQLRNTDESSSVFFSNSEKRALLQIEGERLQALTMEWLELEAKRPIGFSVIEREEPRRAEIGGIGFRYTIDRVDVLDDQRTLVIDYKTGTSSRGDWVGPRVKKPQLPLYVLALEKFKNRAPSGMAVGQVKRYATKFEELAEQGMFKKTAKWALKYEEDWQEALAYWPGYFDSLAKEFIQGKASVNPIGEESCKYCNLTSLCRVSQLRKQSGQFFEQGFSGDEEDHDR